MFTIKEKILLIIGTIFFIFATFSTYYFFKSFGENCILNQAIIPSRIKSDCNFGIGRLDCDLL